MRSALSIFIRIPFRAARGGLFLVMTEKITEQKDNEEVRKFLVKSDCYSTIDFPKYFNFQSLLDNLSNEMKGKDFIQEIRNEDPTKYSDINYVFYQNKDGNLAWRKFQLINPALYIHLVDTITNEDNWKLIVERFELFKEINSNIECLSIPYIKDDKHSIAEESVTNWWKKIVLESVNLSLEYDWLAVTDITDCYGSLYTHTIAWALHKIGIAKKNNSDLSLVGNKIDLILRQMSYGQTNGIPQGSILMDLIAEMVLGYADMLLSMKLAGIDLDENENVLPQKHIPLVQCYKILRYRDDYRIFTKTKEDAVKILKELSEVLSHLNFKLNTQKTYISQELITDSFKSDKLYWNRVKQEEKSLQNQLLLIHNLAKEHSNSGSLKSALTMFIDKITPLTMLKTQNNKSLVAILSDIAAKNSNVYSQVVVAIGKILSYCSNPDEKQKIFELVVDKFGKLPNNCFLSLWLQRLTLKGNFDISKCQKNPFKDNQLCQIIDIKTNKGIWNLKWLKEKYQKSITINWIIDETVIENLPPVPDDDEAKLFISRY